MTYDDTPHHPELETFPFHRHLYRFGRRETDAHQKVSLTQVLQEVLDLMKAG